jgi:hypothetical protein
VEEGREEWSPLSEFGVWLPIDGRPVLGSCIGSGESSTSIWTDVEDRRELTLLERREEMECL